MMGYHQISGWWYLLAGIHIGLCVWGAINVRSGFFIKTLSSAQTTKKTVALTFDDGPLPEYTPRILDILKAHQVKAVFFCIGRHIPDNEDLLQRIHEEGHVIGNHSYCHDFWFDMYNWRRMELDLLNMNDMAENVLDVQPRLFRPPYGVTNPNLATAVRKTNMTAIGWNIRSLDTVAKDEQKLLEHILSKLKPGAVILLHDTCRITADILPALIEGIRQRGYELERVDKLLKIPAYA